MIYNFCDKNLFSRFEKEHHQIGIATIYVYRRAMYLQNSRDGRFTWHVPTIFISGAITRNIYAPGGVARNTYYRGNICKSLPRDARRCLRSSPFTSLFRGRNFFPLTIAIVPSCLPSPHFPFPPFPAVRIRRFSSPAAQHRHRVYGTYGGRYVLWLIVLLSLTYFQFTAAARRFASWLSIVRDERRFICHPGYSGLRPASVLSARHSSCRIRDKRLFHATKKKKIFLTFPSRYENTINLSFPISLQFCFPVKTLSSKLLLELTGLKF